MRLETATPARARAWAASVWRAHRGAVVGVLVLHLLAAGAGLAAPQLLGAVVDTVAGPHGTLARIDTLAGAFVVALVVAAGLRRTARAAAGRLGETVLAQNRERLVGDALTLPLGTVEAVGTGALLSRATTDVERVDWATRSAVPEVLVATVTVAATLVAMVVTSPLLSLALLVAVPTVVVPTRRTWRRLPGAMSRMLDRWSDVQSRTQETVDGARTLEALGLVERRRAQDERHLAVAVEGERDLRAVRVRWIPWLEISHTLPLAVMLVLGAVATARGVVGLGTVATMLVYALGIAGPLDEALWWVEDLLVGGAALRRVLGVSQAVEAVPAPAPDTPDVEGRGLRIRDAWFSYAPGRPVVRGVDLTVPPGERLAVVGGSGAGKSSLARLVAGIAVPDSGSVRLDGHEISRLPEDVRRSEVLLLTQEQHVFAGTLRENLTLPAHPRGGVWDDDELVGALALVGLGGWLAGLPGGLDATVRVGGVPAAVAQQLALARVVLADPHTIVLDEATSLLDTSSARAAERAVREVVAGRTVIAVAHRLHTAASADRVAVMEAGRIIELGPPDELIVADGPFAALVRAAGGSVGARGPVGTVAG